MTSSRALAVLAAALALGPLAGVEASHVPFLTVEVVSLEGATAAIRFTARGGGGVLDVETGDGRYVAISDGWSSGEMEPEGSGVIALSDGAPLAWARTHGDGTVSTVLTFDYLGDGEHELRYRGCCTHTGYERGSLIVAVSGAGPMPPSRAPDPPIWTPCCVATPFNSYGSVVALFAAPGWDGGVRLTTFRVHRTLDGVETLVGEAPPEYRSNLAVRDDDVPQGVDVAYRVVAVNPLGETSGEPRTIRTWVRPGPVRDLQAQAGGPLETVLSWTLPEVAGAPAFTRYRVEHSHDGASFLWTGSTDATTFTFRESSDPLHFAHRPQTHHVFRVTPIGVWSGPPAFACGPLGPTLPAGTACP